MKVVYLVHDVGDPAVGRRVRMFREGGAVPTLLGFHRDATPLREVAGVAATVFGRTADAKLAHRAGTVMRTAARLHRWRDSFRGATVVVARNLEMLFLASLACRRYAPDAALVYESLDVHGSLVAHGAKGWMMRSIEGWLLRRSDMLIVSSRAFVTQHFARRYETVPETLLIENKPLAGEVRAPVASTRGHGKPWVIGWFGVIRCRRSLELLARLARERPGQIEVVIRGRPAYNVLPDFEAIVASTPGMSFGGPYDRSRDLADMYGGVHFTWAVDYYEAGANSAWLLPNRLYEGGAHGAVQIALDTVATGHWLSDRHAGVVLAEPLSESLGAYFDGLTDAGYESAQAALAAVPVDAFVAATQEAVAFVDRLAGLVPASQSRDPWWRVAVDRWVRRQGSPARSRAVREADA